MNRPILLTKAELIKPISDALSRINTIQSHISKQQENIIFEGFFVLAIASFETSIVDTLKVLLKHIPEKLNSSKVNLSKSDLLNENPLEIVIDSHIQAISYKSIHEIINISLEYLSIDVQIAEQDLNVLQENKARRNLLIHNNLRNNKIYEETAGSLKSMIAELKITLDYLNTSISVIKSILTKVKNSISEKYKEYTNIKSLKALFEYCFSTPIMKFENEWIVDDKRDVIVAYNSKQSRRGGLSSSEQTLFSFWHIHLCGLDSEMDNLNFWGLSEGNREKVSFLLSNLKIFQT